MIVVVCGPVYMTFQAAYLDVLRYIMASYRYRTAGRGNDALEVTNTSFTLTDPLARIPYLAARRSNIVFNYAEVLWYLAGRDDLTMIGYYAPPATGVGRRRAASDWYRLRSPAVRPVRARRS